MVFAKQQFFKHSFKAIGLIMLLALSSSVFALAQLAGSKSAYQYDNQQMLTPAPKGYSAFYIDHVGRHGSRYISKAKYEDIAYSVLILAEKNNQLTPAGKALITQVAAIKQLNNKHYGELTDLGRNDIALISKRMLANNPTVFKGQKIEVLSSTSSRAKETAQIFMQAFQALYPDIEIATQPEDQQFLLRFFNYAPAYDEYKKSGLVKQALTSLEHDPKTIEISRTVGKKIFTDAFLSQLNEGISINDKSPIKTEDFVIALFQLYQELLALPSQVLVDNHLDFDDYFSVDDNAWLNTVVTAKNYLQIGPAWDANGIQIKIAAPLLWDMLTSADKAIENGHIDANLRFAHAETVSPLATLLEIEGAATVAASIFDYPNVWRADKIVPMGANIQWIFYRSEQANQPILVKVLLNEREVHLPISTVNYPYYRWDEVKQFYTDKLNKLGLMQNQNMMKMLQNLQ